MSRVRRVRYIDGNKSHVYGGGGKDKLTGSRKVLFYQAKNRYRHKLGKDDIGLVYALDLKFKQKGDDLRIKGNDGVNTLLLGIDKDDFLKDVGNGTPELLPAVQVDLI